VGATKRGIKVCLGLIEQMENVSSVPSFVHNNNCEPSPSLSRDASSTNERSHEAVAWSCESATLSTGASQAACLHSATIIHHLSLPHTIVMPSCLSLLLTSCAEAQQLHNPCLSQQLRVFRMLLLQFACHFLIGCRIKTHVNLSKGS